MDEPENTIALKDFITSLSISSLPRILQIASGVYLQSSVYDIRGSECCLSTGDLLKIIGRELQSVTLVNIKTGKTKTLPNNYQEGRFYERENMESYTLEQILQSPVLLRRNFKCRTIGPEVYKICPEYELKTVMNMRKGLVMIPSSLEVDVIDITDKCGNITFIQPLSLEELCEHESKFPVVAEIVDVAECNHLLKNYTYSALQKGKEIVIHKKTISRKVLAKACKGNNFRFFYIHEQYQGKFRQRPKEFSSVYELWTKMAEGTHLSVVVTQDCESSDDNFPSLFFGDHLCTLHQTKTIFSSQRGPQEVDVLVCKKESADDDVEEDDEPEEIMLPLYMDAHFVEEVKDNKKYNISSVIERHKLPCDVKVVAKDTSLPNDPLTSFSTLTLEEVIDEPVLLVSLLDNASECFELSLKYLNISVVLQDKSVPSTRDLISSNKLEELLEWFYYSLRKDLPTQQLPPPRPPKRQVKSEKHQSCNKPVEPKIPDHLNLKKSSDTHAKPPVPHRKVSEGESKTAGEICKLQRVNEYIPTPRRNTVRQTDSDSDHDYEDIKEQMKAQLKIVTKATKQIRF